MRFSPFGRSIGALASAGILALTCTGTASAAVPVQDRGIDAGSQTLVNHCGSETDFLHEYSYRYMDSTKTRGPDTPLYFSSRFRGSETYTNLDTGRTFTIRNGGNFIDQMITVNDDGTLTIIQQFAGNQIVSNDSGILFKDAGVFRQRIVVKHQGTLDNADDDTVVEEATPIFETGPNDTLSRDFCADLLEFTA